MYNKLRAAIELLKDYCINTLCSECPLNHVLCCTFCSSPSGYSLERFDENVQELESEEQ